MIQRGSFLKVIDNSGAKNAYCIRIISNSSKRYAFVGDLLLVSVKSLRAKRRFSSKVKTGTLVRALIVRSKITKFYFFGDNLKFYENSAVLLNKQNKLIGTRIFGLLPNSLRYTRFMKLLSVCAGTRD
jgi:large subunit ribosomal protein L14